MFNPNRLIPYSRQLIEEEDIRAVVEVLRSDYLTQGPAVGCFEEALAAFCGAKFAVVFATGTAALHGAYHAAGLSPGNEIITSPNTFAATSNAALYLGARPV
ncbi:MAG TPA: DegT/DnrJ/EryC1/StrS family aminotransferase, partial [Candidatus Sumerlaeota bacterium]|nr:DegT/DnrJ/EryC1/StrS family aminotransferase [Candidatus Sumerlaeota bacterium]